MRPWMMLALAAVALPTAAHGQDATCDKMMQPPPVGAWAEYRTHRGPLRLAVVGTEERRGVRHYWFEVALSGSPATVVKMLIPGGLAQMDSIAEVILKLGNQPAMVLPQASMGMMSEQYARSAATNLVAQCRRSERVGTESITVPAGTYRTTHYRHPEGDAWVTDDVPFHAVKTVDKMGREMVLVATGSGAESAITETPMKMPGM